MLGHLNLKNKIRRDGCQHIQIMKDSHNYNTGHLLRAIKWTEGIKNKLRIFPYSESFIGLQNSKIRPL